MRYFIRSILDSIGDLQGIRILLDLVPGHTSEEHPHGFWKVSKRKKNGYIWADHAFCGGDGIQNVLTLGVQSLSALKPIV